MAINVALQRAIAHLKHLLHILTKKRKAAKERRQRAKQLKKAEKHAKKRIAARKAPQKASDCMQYLSMSQDGICEVEPGLFSMTMAFTDVNFQIFK